ncbi:type II CAAX endopeptidase family protein [Paludibacter sp.]|uniref:type II CAAX endopeptidase family protein n=1 Tax=Paludibacter sp. TaxID=1898105 RepID=UPI001354A4AD|nr:type II CAAX endopeptidase family protein [Paludibacter sp.]MTK52760.1 CPBP family intramembrane metalloprotease [Paludibacter sp.]
MSNVDNYKDQQTGKKMFILIGSSVGLTLLTSLVISVILLFKTMANGGNLNEIRPDITFLKISQLIVTVVTFLVPVLLLSKISRVKSKIFVRADKGLSFVPFLLAVLLMLAIQPLMNATADWFSNWSLPSSFAWLEHWLKNMEKQNLELVRNFLDVNSAGGLLFNILVVAIAPAICEEFFFRGGLQQVFYARMNKHVAIWLAAAVFSAVHMEVSGFLPRMVLGASFGYLFIWTGSIWAPVIAHFVNNLCGVVTEYLIFNHMIDKNIEKVGTGDTLWATVLGSAVFLASLWLVYRLHKSDLSESNT